MYQALYRKWRPRVFSDVIGQEHIVDTLKNQIIHNRISHAYLFCGSRGTGKTTTAKIFSRAVNCLHPVDGNPCNECAACLGILNGSNIDVVEIDAASNNKVDNIREIRDEVIYPPADVKYKVYIIDEAHMLTTSAFNALLKTLEEPPAYVIFILATTEFHKIPATILSRCQKFDFKRITYRDTAKRVQQVVRQDGLKVSEEGINLLAKAADGSIRDALSILDQCVSAGKEEIGFGDIAGILGASDPAFISRLSRAVIEEDISTALVMVNEAVYNGIDILKLSDDLVEYFRNLMIVKTTGKPSEVLDISDEKIAELSRLAASVPLNRILKIIEVLFETMNYAKFITNPKFALETAMLKIAAKQTERDTDAILNRLELLEQKIAGGYQIPAVSEQQSQYSEKPEEKESIPAVTEEWEGPEVTVFEEGVSLEELLKQPAEPQVMPEEVLPEEETASLPEETEPVPELEEVPENEMPDPLEEEAESEETEDYMPIEDADMEESFLSFAQQMQQAEEEMEEEGASAPDETVQRIVEQFGRVVEDSAADADFAFRGILERGQVEAAGGNTIRIVFGQNSLYHIAKMSKYDKLIQQSIQRLFAQEVTVELAETESLQEKTETEEQISPLEDVIQKIQEDDEIRFHLE